MNYFINVLHKTANFNGLPSFNLKNELSADPQQMSANIYSKYSTYLLFIRDRVTDWKVKAFFSEERKPLDVQPVAQKSSFI